MFVSCSDPVRQVTTRRICDLKTFIIFFFFLMHKRVSIMSVSEVPSHSTGWPKHGKRKWR